MTHAQRMRERREAARAEGICEKCFSRDAPAQQAQPLTDEQRKALRIVADHCAGFLNFRNIVYALLDTQHVQPVSDTQDDARDFDAWWERNWSGKYPDTDARDRAIAENAWNAARRVPH
jgi:hypothetical protein